MLAARTAIILGGKGIVGSALQHLMAEEGWKCQVIDKDQSVDQEGYIQILQRTKVAGTWIIDLIPNLPKAWSARQAGQRGHNYINTTSLNGKPGLCEFLSILDEHRKLPSRGKVLLSAGANPGIVNIFGEELVREFGPPHKLISWEYDENTLGKRAVITWNKEEFLEECATGYWPEPQENGLIRFNREKPCDNLQSLPVIPWTSQGVQGMVTPHEECIMLGWRHKCASHFYYAFNPANPILQAIRNGKVINQSRHTLGSDTIGMTWKKGKKEFTIAARKSSVPLKANTNTTGWLVAFGIMSAIKSSELLKPGYYVPEELPADRFLDSLLSYCEIIRC